MPTTISIIIAAFNEEKNIVAVLAEINELQSSFSDLEFIVVDDGSTDSTYKIALRHFPETTLRHNKNRGQGASLKTGIRHATGDFVILMDGDGQHPVEAIKNIIVCILNDPSLDAVLTERDNIYSSGIIRSLGKLVINKVVNLLTEESIRDTNCGLRAFNRKKILPFLFLLPDGFSYSTTSTVLSYMEDFKIAWIRITMRPRTQGESLVRTRHAFNTVILVFRLIVLFNPLKFFVPLSAYSFLFGVFSMIISLLSSESLGKNYIFFFLFGSLAFILGLLSEQISVMRKEIHSIKRVS